MEDLRLEAPTADERKELNDVDVITVLDKMLKQRRESIKQFEVAKREDLIQKENFEISVIQEFLPEQLEENEIKNLITKAIKETKAQSVKDMGAVMTLIRPKVQGRSDMGKVSALVKEMISKV